MVIARTFVWAHVPKTGGDTTAQMLSLFPELVVSIDAHDDLEKHRRFGTLSEEDAAKPRVLGVRRLPSWILSYAVHRTRYGVAPTFTPERAASPYELSTLRIPDLTLQGFLDGSPPAALHWLRMERLGADVVQLLSEWTPVAPTRRRAVIGMTPRNAGSYDRRLEHWFSPDDLARMYTANPVWAAVEKLVYGDVLAPSRGVRRRVRP
jgi:hypothetical protein